MHFFSENDVGGRLFIFNFLEKMLKKMYLRYFRKIVSEVFYENSFNQSINKMSATSFQIKLTIHDVYDF